LTPEPASTATPAPSPYLDQNYLSGIAKGKPGVRELGPVLRVAITAPWTLIDHPASALLVTELDHHIVGSSWWPPDGW
jgi:hypothetical protein